MSALVVTVLAVLVVAGVLLAGLIHHPTAKETTMAGEAFIPLAHTSSQSIGIQPSPEFEPPTMALDAQFEDIGDRGSCTTRGRHEHRWWKVVDRGDPVDQVHLSIVIETYPSGLVMLTEGSVEEILTAAGFERADR